MVDKTGKDIDIQATIEEPQLYILGQSRSTVEDQMKFVPTRQKDLRDLRNPVLTDSKLLNVVLIGESNFTAVLISL